MIFPPLIPQLGSKSSREVGQPVTKGTTLPEPLLLQRAHVVFAEHKGDLSLHLLSLFNRVNDEKVPCR